jgi:diacylglycerol kinase family enzyme
VRARWLSRLPSGRTGRLSPQKRVFLIVNPYATKVTEERTAAVVRALGRVAEVSTVLTERPRHATELARGAGDADAVVVFSGDGGFNEALNGVDRQDLPLGFVPGGGTSVLPRALGLSRDPEHAARQIADALEHGRVRTMSTGRVNGRRFAFNAGIGIDAEAVRRIDARGRSAQGKRPGDVVFASTFLGLIAERRGRFDPALELRGHGRAAFVLVANVHPYSYVKALAVRIAPEVVFEEGLDFFAPIAIRPRALPGLVRYIFTGGGRPNVLKGHDLDRIEVVCDAPMPLQADGEDLGDVTEAVFEAERRSIRVLA